MLLAPGRVGRIGSPSGSAGLVPALDATAEQIRSAIRDISKYGESLGPELVSNGGFTAGSTGWTDQDAGRWSYAGGVASHTAGGTLGPYQNIGTVTGKVLTVTFTVASISAGSVQLVLGAGPSLTSRNAAGTYTERVSASGNGNLVIGCSSDFVGSIDNISVREVLGGGFLLPGTAGARINAAARSSVAMERVKDEVLGAELVTNGGFDSDTWWGKESGWSIAGGVAVRAAGPAGALLRADLLTVGKTYRVTLDTLAMTSTIGIYVGGASATLSATVATGRSVVLTCNTHGTLQIYGGGEYTIDNVSVREVIVPAGGYQYAPHNRIFPSNGYANAWTKFASAISAGATAPDGSASARMTVNAGNVSLPLFGTTVPIVSGETVTWYSVARYVNTQWFWLRGDYPDSTGWAAFDIQNGVVGNKMAGVLASGIAAIGGGWYLCWFTQTAVAGGNGNLVIRPGNNVTPTNSTISYAGTEAVDLWHSGLCSGAGQPTIVPTTTAAVFAPAITFDSAINDWRTQAEAAATNLLLQSANKASVSWQKGGGSTIVAGTHACPISGVVESLSVSTTSGFYQLAAGANSTQYTAWMAVRLPPSGNTVRFGLTNQNETAIYYVLLDSAGALVADVANNAGFTGGSHSVAQLGSTGWYLLVVTATSPASGTTGVGHYCRLLLAGSVPIGHSQLETGPRATSPILTYGATATRAAEIPAIPTGTAISETVGTIVVDHVMPVVSSNVVFSLGAYANGIYSTGASQNLTCRTGDVTVADLNAGTTLASPAVNKVGIVYGTNDYAVSLNGSAPVADTNGAMPTGLGNLYPGSLGGGYQAGGGITRLRVYNKRLPNAQLQALTA